MRQAGVDATLTHYPEAVHAFLSMPGLVAAARPARAEILGYLRTHLLARPGEQTCPLSRRIRRRFGGLTAVRETAPFPFGRAGRRA
ncbi:hypothetical protein IFM12275_50480 [Nocardia sputorum]|nr:hypothetical protein IFM12275_50480 [Nocardia sputorum]